ncbi:unnamed protein product [Brassica oleracea]
MIPLITQTFQNLYHCSCYTYWIVKSGMEHLKSHFLNCCFFSVNRSSCHLRRSPPWLVLGLLAASSASPSRLKLLSSEEKDPHFVTTKRLWEEESKSSPK